MQQQPCDFRQQFHALAAFLQQHQPFWHCVAFAQATSPWQHSELDRWLAALSDDELAQLEDHGQQLAHALDVFFPGLAQWQQHSERPIRSLELSPLQTNHADDAPVARELPFWLSNGIKGRKKQQISDFAQAVAADLPVVEWCAGKGHLGRALAYWGASKVCSVEWDAALCEQGQQAADKLQLPVRFHHADVLQAQADDLLQPGWQAVALHACGQLHIHLLQRGAAQGLSRFAVAPCCYHLIADEHYQPLSRQGQAQALLLDKHDLKLAVQQSTDHSPRALKLRKTESLWRMAFSVLQQQLAGHQHYVPVPTMPKALLTGRFAEFCQWAAAQKQLPLPAEIDEQYYLTAAQQRLHWANRVELVRHGFRSLLEHYLLLDRVVFLQEHGYAVQLQTFCNMAQTPRNALILATKPVAN